MTVSVGVGDGGGAFVRWSVRVHLWLFLPFSAINTGFLPFRLGPFKSHRQRGTVFNDLLVRLVPRRFFCTSVWETLRLWNVGKNPALPFSDVFPDKSAFLS